MVNLDDLDTVKTAEDGFMLDCSKFAPGVKLKILGHHSKQVRKAQIIYYRKIRDLRERKVELSDDEFATSAEEYEIIRSANRIGGWEGIEQSYTPELARKLCEINPEIREFIIQESEKVENFTTGK